ncbi:MAG: hypothetical protein LBV46_01785 [Bacteroidales bacterium]|jgi:hypothetical protein|nr:hypothetical protein [Bacteroidales bacterium]
MEIVAQYSLWFILLAVLLGAAYAFVLYFRDKNVEFEKRPKIIMALCRGLSVTLIALLLLGLMIKLSIKETEKPILILAVDNSESLRLIPDSNYYKNIFPAEYQKFIKELDDRFEIRNYLLGSSPKEVGQDTLADNIQFNQKSTNLSSIFDEVSQLYGNRNVGAMVLLTDGIYNSGANPYYKSQKLTYPVYAVGMGNAEIFQDLFIADIVHNRQTYKGNFAPVEIKVAATKLTGKNSRLTVTDAQDQEIFAKNISISSNQYYETVKFSIESKEKGIKKYKVSLSNIEGEISTQNNQSVFYIEVIDSKDKIAIIYNAPHPDVSAIRSAIEASDNYEVEVFSADNFTGKVEAYSLVILHQLPSQNNSAGALITQLANSKSSVLYILGEQSNIKSFDKINQGFAITQSRQLYNQVMPEFNPNFTLFSFSDEAKKMLERYAPLQTFFGDYQVNGAANVFLYQNINHVVTKYPLILFSDNQGQKTGAILGDGIWRWRLHNYMYAQNHDAFNEIVMKIAQYLSVKGDKSRMRINAETLYDEGSPVDFSAELYNESYELITTPDLSMTVTDAEGKKYDYQFSKQNNAYNLNMGVLPVGDYHWASSAKIGTETIQKTGSFTVKEVLLESKNLTADFDLLKSIAQDSQGKFYTDKQLSELSKEINDNPLIKTIANYVKKYSLLLNSFVYLALILLLMTVEWFLRKWHGSY